jgi:hypothetical protein
MPLSHLKLEKLKEQIDKLDTNEHIQIYQIMQKGNPIVTTTQNGVLISSETISEETILEVEKYVLFCMDQRRRMDEDLKTRKNYERMVSE